MAREIRIKVGSATSKILDNIEGEVVKELSDAMSYAVKGARFSKAYIDGHWDGRKRLFSSAKFTFPSGLLSVAVKIIEKRQKVSIINMMEKPERKFDRDFTFKFPLREYQVEAVDKIIKSRVSTLVVSTGGGKTIIALKTAQELGVKTLFLVNTKEALYDTVRSAKECFKDEVLGIMGDGKSTIGDFITIATVASMYRRVKEGKVDSTLFDFIIIDECHHVGSESWMLVVNHFEAFYKVGMTGTNFRTDGSSILLVAMAGPVCMEVKAKSLQEEGHLAESLIYFLEMKKPENLDRPLEYRELYDFGIVNNKDRNKAVVDIVKKYLGKSILVVFENLEHGRILHEMILKVDKKAVLISGKTKKRDLLKERFESGETKTVVASRIYNESADIPILEVVINASGGKSGIAVLQRIGRALRLFATKNKALIFDFLDVFNMNLENHSRDRLKWIRKEKHEYKVIKSLKEVE